MPRRFEAGPVLATSVIFPAVSILLILPICSVNQRLPSPQGPVVIALGFDPAVGIANSPRSLPAVSILPIRLALSSVNQRLPSGPTVLLSGGLPTANSPSSAPLTPILPILLVPPSVNQSFPS